MLEADGAWFQSIASTGSSNTYTNAYGLSVLDASISGTDSLENNYGIYIYNISEGENNYAFYSAGGDLFVQDAIRTNGSLCLYDDCITSWDDVNESTSSNNITGYGTTNYLSKWTNGSNLDSSLIYDDGSSIGIGTNSPDASFHVTGDSYISVTEDANAPNVYVASAFGGPPGNGGDTYIGYCEDGSLAGCSAGDTYIGKADGTGQGGSLYVGQGPTGDGDLVSYGQLGIGGSPSHALDLTGSGDQIVFTGNNGGNGEGVLYTDSSATTRYGLMFPGSDIVALANRASNGVVQIRANTGTAGAGGEVITATFEDDVISFPSANVGVGTNAHSAIGLRINPTGDSYGLYMDSGASNYAMHINGNPTYGIYLPVSGTYGIYQSSGTPNNYFAGNVGLDETAPANKLHVTVNDRGISSWGSSGITIEGSGWLNFGQSTTDDNGIMWQDTGDTFVTSINYNNQNNYLRYYVNNQITGYMYDEWRVGSGGTVSYATGNGDLYVQDDIEIDGLDADGSSGYVMCYDPSSGRVTYNSVGAGGCSGAASPFFRIYADDGKMIENIEFLANLNSSDKDRLQTYTLQNHDFKDMRIQIENIKPETEYMDLVEIVLIGTFAENKNGALEYYRLEINNTKMQQADEDYLVMETNTTTTISFEEVPKDFIVYDASLRVKGYYEPYMSIDGGNE